jgi:hypothetical protein
VRVRAGELGSVGRLKIVSEYTLDWLSSDTLVAVVPEEFDRWRFRFASGGTLFVQCPWRVIENGAICISSVDDKQQYGLPSPINAAAEVSSLLGGDVVAIVHVEQASGDVRLTFESGKELQVLPFSSGYEAWESLSPQGFNVIAQGGQQLAGFKP